jgi:HSP20 family protein
MMEIDTAIAQVERLCTALTGKPPGAESAAAALPPEKEPEVHVAEQIDRLLVQLGRTSDVVAAAPSWIPPVMVWEGPREVALCIDLPGVPRESVNVSVASGLLAVSGHRGSPLGESNGLELRSTERPLGSFHRVLALPPGVQAEQITAELRDGVLVIRSPRRDGQGPRPIPVK